jgi:uncharacterized membrane protein
MAADKRGKQKNLIHVTFEIGLVVKAVDGALETIGAILILFLNPSRINSIARFLTQRELSEDPRDMVANLLLRFAQNFSVDTQYFGIVYLAAHGIIKLFLVYFLWRKRLWAYPLSMAALVLFIAYQVYRYSISPSAILMLLTVFDLAMLYLTYREYKRMKAAKAAV